MTDCRPSARGISCALFLQLHAVWLSPALQDNRAFLSFMSCGSCVVGKMTCSFKKMSESNSDGHSATYFSVLFANLYDRQTDAQTDGLNIRPSACIHACVYMFAMVMSTSLMREPAPPCFLMTGVCPRPLGDSQIT